MKDKKPTKIKKIYFIGIGGIGMSAIARILNRQGCSVSGSDEKDSQLIYQMRGEGIECRIGHSEANLLDCDTVVYSSAITVDNVELRYARRRKFRVMHRAEMLSELIAGKKSIAVTGAHGKTTTTALLAWIFEKSGKKPTAAIGGEVFNFKSNALYGKGGHFIFEADESDGSFIKFHPDCAVLLNIDKEHFNYFKNIDNVVDSYCEFMKNVNKSGAIYYNADDERLNRLVPGRIQRCVSFGTGANSAIRAVDISQSAVELHFRCVIRGKTMREKFLLPMPGRHNVMNALAAIAVAHEAGIDAREINAALRTYKGTKRRFEIKKMPKGITLVEDYAHHPREIEAVLEACKPLKKNIIVVFQPHRYTRTKELFEEFSNCFKHAAQIILTDIYAASEKGIEGVTAEKLFLRMKENGAKNAQYMKKNMIAAYIKAMAKKDDLVLVLGAGDIYEVASELLKQ